MPDRTTHTDNKPPMELDTAYIAERIKELQLHIEENPHPKEMKLNDASFKTLVTEIKKDRTSKLRPPESVRETGMAVLYGMKVTIDESIPANTVRFVGKDGRTRDIVFAKRV